MARIAANRIEESPMERRRYNVGIYARLSVEGDERKNESIDTQIDIGKQFVKQHPEMGIYDIYTDLGATGTNFERAGFQRMLQDVRRRNIDCVIVKDLSRLGRDCVETGNYIQKIFPFMNVRFIAVADGIDTFNPEHTPDELTINLKNLVNEMYAKDIAQKVKASKQAQWENGSYTGGVAPYGYEYEWVGKKRILKVEPLAAEIVKEVFRLRLSGYNLKQIARELYQKKIHTPSVMHSCGHVNQQDGETLAEWSKGTIKWMLTNPVYMGCLVQGTTCGKKYRICNRQDIETRNFDVHLNTHEAVISEEDFYKAAHTFEQSALYCKEKGVQKTVPSEEDIYQDVIVCGDCGRKMYRVANIKTFGSGDKIRWYGYRCNNSERIDIKCPSKGIAKTKIDELVLAALKQEFKLSVICPKAVMEECKLRAEKDISSLQRQIDKINASLLSLNKRSSELYLQYRMGDMSVGDYQKQKEQIAYSIEKNNKRLDAYNEEIRNVNRKVEEKCTYFRQLVSGRNENVTLDRETINMLIQRIEVYEKYRVKVTVQ